ncbi:putative metal-dependent hydrolase [Halapricum desulfuricans]|uniref:Putative metal-dependent hydrolase n=2 Tax=Halapricum desulfuricans TaxID=2841257 RepID=A0A897N0K3_9EURY|nr:putative metal-dependent hydrolase [Halapricum desulfuricans]
MTDESAIGVERKRGHMDAHLRAGIAIYNEGYYHAAHDAWEEHWLTLSTGPDKDFLQGLIQYTAAVYHTTTGNWLGTRKLARKAQTYLEGLGERYRGVDLRSVRLHLRALEREPERVGRESPPAIEHEGRALGFEVLGFEATAVAATVLAEEWGYDEDAFERAAEYARSDVESGYETSPFVALLFDFVREGDRREPSDRASGETASREGDRREPSDGAGDAGAEQVDHRDIIAQRLGEHVDRRGSRESDVSGLF